MTESDWWAATDSRALVDWLFFDTSAIERKVRLFAAACCRRVEDRIGIHEVSAALSCVELFADGLVPESHVVAVRDGTIRAYQDHWGGMLDTTKEADACRAVISALSDAGNLRMPFHRSREWYVSEDNFPYPYWAACDATDSVSGDAAAPSLEEMRERASQVRLLHDIFGPLPFRDIAIDPAWLTSDVLALSRGIYEDKTFDRMPILADALQDAGCDSADILDHCRDASAEHVRGCWVIDLLLGRPWRESP